MQPTPTLWAIVGATGTGKTELSLTLAENIAAKNPLLSPVVINADAMQFYRGMNIGTAKLAPEERRDIQHFLFDALKVTEEASVAWYQPLARKIAHENLAAGRDVILVGGSGLYVSSVIYDFQFPPTDNKLRANLNRQLDEQGIEALLTKLRELAPDVAETIDRQNPRRVIRALELALQGRSAATNLPAEPILWYQNTRILGVQISRDELVPRLDLRVHKMWQNGLIDEVEGLMRHGLEHGATASRAIGYQQAIAQIRGEMTEPQAIEVTAQLTRRYARRQVSWFKRYQDVTWIDGLSSFDELQDVIASVTA